jgi:prolyl oligopeptidase PreP (S9A serine peptidase family)
MNPWYAELGYADESAEDAKRLLELSPLHNIEKSDPMDPYPAMLVITCKTA